ncbi:tautomerase family protein [Actinomycetospora sp. CA-101289]|uniref:tautomerase family protein n=1 Tax=Actinomycetospora sp. CA-101289 TaxID=3239893 RepID=UPI003D957C8E
MRIDMVRGRSPEQVRALADVVQEVMLDVFAAPPRDRYQVIHQHDPGEIVAEDTGLGYTRTDGVVVIQVTQQGRSREQKEAMYAALAQRLGDAGLVEPDDLIVSVTENTKDDWSFGRGRAQFLTGEL